VFRSEESLEPYGGSNAEIMSNTVSPRENPTPDFLTMSVSDGRLVILKISFRKFQKKSIQNATIFFIAPDG